MTPGQQRVRELRRRSLRGLPLVGKRRHDAGAAIDELAYQLEQAQDELERARAARGNAEAAYERECKWNEQAQARERGLREAIEGFLLNEYPEGVPPNSHAAHLQTFVSYQPSEKARPPEDFLTKEELES